jgi:NAD(P)-dependent dehydrogenase (short-subunit alcohol dehydrogenase family)
MDRLKGKQALITGASRGLGHALALAFAREGASDIALVARSGPELENVAREVARVHRARRVLAIEADLRRADDVERVVATVLAHTGGRLDVLVNNASDLGPSPMPLLVDYPVDAFRQVLETNLIAPFLLIQKLLPALLQSRGSVINVTSDAGVTGYAGWGAYGISKFGLEGLTKTWAAELAETGVRVNAVDPGDMNTEMHRAAEPDADPAAWARPDDVTDVFVHLASDAARRVNGRRFQAQEEGWGQALETA